MFPFLSGLEPADRAFFDELNAFLDAELDPATVAAEDAQRSMVADPERALPWIDKLRPRGWHIGHWPVEHGGPGLSRIQNYLLLYQMGLRGAPHLPPQGLNYTAPVVMAFGTASQKAEILPRIADGTDFWCQGFSEPGSGSDLASVKTFAERRGDAYVVSGTKIWTTDAHRSNRIFCLVRTRRENTRDAMSFILVDMDSPGITVRPIRLMSGDHDLNQVFFDEVEVPAGNLLGAEGQGWEIAKYLLDIERGQFVFGGRLRRRLDRARRRAHEAGLDDPDWWSRAARIDIDLMAYECTEFRLGHAGECTTADASAIKIEWTEILQRIDDLGVDASGTETLYAGGSARGEAVRSEGLPIPDWLASYLNNRAATIYGGSNEIQRNLVYRGLRAVRP
ncbi:MAG: acyl-CoA dehydrogenase family protein [Gammaproteobacteria bacterium]